MANLREDEVVSLAESCRAGNSAAFDRLRDAYEGALTGFVMARLPSAADEDSLGDVIQDIWITAWKNIDRFDASKGAFYTFLTRCIGAYVVKRYYDSRKSDYTSLDQLLESEHIQEPADSESDPAEILAREMEARALAESFLTLSRVLFLCGGYPHQQLAFAFLKVLRTPGSKDTGSAESIVQNLSHLELDQLAKAFDKDYREQSGLGPQYQRSFSSALAPLQTRLRLTVDRLMAADKASTATFSNLLDKVTGATLMKDYFGDRGQKPSAAVSDWAYKVQKRMRTVIDGIAQPDVSLTSDVCDKCKLRKTDPCVDLEDRLSMLQTGAHA